MKKKTGKAAENLLSGLGTDADMRGLKALAQTREGQSLKKELAGIDKAKLLEKLNSLDKETIRSKLKSLDTNALKKAMQNKDFLDKLK